ncbi:hypothetical protein [Pseudomonas sp.]|uniref:hypothetical protein n=1 Tax=Pseudomonas sp. TaxID=306 RepID=UPI003FD6DB78
MSDNYPRMLYKKGGTNPEPVHGHILGIKVVQNATEEDDAQEDGWHRTTIEAVDAARPAAEGQAGDDAPKKAGPGRPRKDAEVSK